MPSPLPNDDPSKSPIDDQRSSPPALKRNAEEMGRSQAENPPGDSTMDVDGDGDGKSKKQQSSSRHRRETSVDMIGNSHGNGKESSEETVSSGSDSVYPTPSSMSTYTTAASEESRARSDSFSHSSHDAPSIDEQVATVMGLMAETPTEGDRGYVVSSSWLKRVLARSSRVPVADKDKTSAQGEVGPVDNSDLVLVTDPATMFKDEAGKPFVPLRPGLQLSEDYEIVPEKAWHLIIKWYGLSRDSPAIVRYAHNTNVAGGLENFQYELNPPVFTILKLSNGMATPTQELRDKSRPPVKTLASTHTPVQKWLRDIKELASIDMSTKVRVWRILEGLNSSSGSGALTPAASRSASPAPGSIVTANAGNSLVLDVNTFAALNEGSQRELLEIKDQTASGKYNGRSFTLHLAGLGGDSVIVLEEQVGGEWISESKGTAAKFAAKNLKAKVKAKSAPASGRSSPVPSVVRGRRRKDGKPRGVTGLTNLGNTCYMNSALQCVRSVEELTLYFLQNAYKKDLNPSNPLSHNGDVAKAYANLLHQLFDENGMASFAPRAFKSTIGRYGPSFSGYAQQDSQEFLLFLLDGLQEDLNRIVKKPYIEKPDSTDEMVHDRVALEKFAQRNWEIYKARNDSVITDLFAGMYKSTLHCPVCDKVSIIFDPFNNLTLQLPIESMWSKTVFYFPLNKPPVYIDVEIDKNASVKALKEYVAKKVNSDAKRLVMAEIYMHKFFKVFDNTTCLSETGIKGNDDIAFFELESVPTSYDPDRPKKTGYTSMLYMSSYGNDEEIAPFDSPRADRMLIPIYNRVVKPNLKFNSRKLFGAPLFTVIHRDEAFDFDAVLQKILAAVSTMTTRDILREDEDEVMGSGSFTAAEHEAEDSDVVVTNEEDATMSDPQVKDASVEGEDGLVDVSMRDASQDETAADAPSASTPKVLRRGSFIPPGLRTLFDVKVVKTVSATGTGNNAVDENRELQLMMNRVTTKDPKVLQKHASVRQTTQNSPASSEDERAGSARLGNTKPEEDSRDSSSAETKDESVSDSDSDDIPPNPNRPVPTWKKPKRCKPKRVSTTPLKLPYIRPGEAIVLDWREDTYDALFGADPNDKDPLRGSATWDNVQRLPDPELDKRRQLRQHKKRHGVTLDECLDEYGKEEILSENDAWYCPRCKDFRRASKKFELWKVPDILVMHLKRFSASRGFRDKLDVLVDFPLELDMTGRVMMPEEGKSLQYDLIAVDNHYGGLGGGHYTAFAKNFVDGHWYEYNDSHVSRKLDPSSVVTKAAYLLFYRRRSDRPLGGEALASLTESAYKDASADSDDGDASDDSGSGRDTTGRVSGEGKRLAGSSRNGSSSALTGVAAAHQSGDGGLQGGIRRIAASEDDGDEDGLPPYSDGPRTGEQRLQYSSRMDLDEGYDDRTYTYQHYDKHTYSTRGPGPVGLDEPAWSFGRLDPSDEPYAYDESAPQNLIQHGPSFDPSSLPMSWRRIRSDDEAEDDDSMKALRSDDDDHDDDSDTLLSPKLTALGADSDDDDVDVANNANNVIDVDEIFVGHDHDEDEVMLDRGGRGRAGRAARDREEEEFSFVHEPQQHQQQKVTMTTRGGVVADDDDDDEEDELPVVELQAPAEQQKPQPLK